MKKILLFLIILMCNYVYAQTNEMCGSEGCSHRKMNGKHILLNNDASPNSPVHSFDVLAYKLYVDIYNCFITPFPKSYTGNLRMPTRIDSTVNSIKLHANNLSLGIDTVRASNIPFTFTHTANILTINLDRTYTPGDQIVVDIIFHHNNVTDNSFYVSNGMCFTDFPPEGARGFFPCWDKPGDKATWDFTARVPTNVLLGSNGRLADSIVSGGAIFYNWISRDPISTYLMTMIGKVNYNLDVIWWKKISNPNDSVPIRFYWNTGESGLANIKSKMPAMMTRYS
jgi:aminopeptidase N